MARILHYITLRRSASTKNWTPKRCTSLPGDRYRLSVQTLTPSFLRFAPAASGLFFIWLDPAAKVLYHADEKPVRHWEAERIFREHRQMIKRLKKRKLAQRLRERRCGMEAERRVSLLFPRSWQLVSVYVPASAVDYVKERNMQYWLSLYERDAEQAMQIGEQLGLVLPQKAAS